MSRASEAAIVLDIVRVRARVAWLLTTRPLDDAVRTLAAHPVASRRDPPAIAALATWSARLLRNRRRPRNTCLHRALTRFALLRRYGAEPEFVMGLHPDRALEGHAWVTLDGAPWMEEDTEQLVPTYVYPPRHE